MAADLATLCLFRDDSYLTEAAATVLEVNERGGIVLDRTVFYVTGGGQPSDSGVLKTAEGAPVENSTAVYGESDRSCPGGGCSESAAGRAGRSMH
jgi:misacylated tRNA(Ala) deacylase